MALRRYADTDRDYEKNMETVSVVIEDMWSATNETMWNTINSIKGWRAQVMLIAEYLNETICRSSLKMMAGVVYVFNGVIYVPVAHEVFSRALDMYLKRMKVDPVVMYNGASRIKKEAYESIALNCPLHPTYNVHCFLNGVVDLRDGEIHDFSPEYHVVYQHDYEFRPNARCPMWDKFLRDILEDKKSRLLLQMYFGLCCYDRGYMHNKVENCLILYGAGSNGKSVIQEVLTGVLGEPNVSHMDLKSLTKGGDEQMRNMCQIDGKLINLGAELSKREIIGREDEFKKLVSGEDLYARRIGGNVYNVTNVPWCVFNMNNMLQMNDVSHGVQRRILYCVFDKIIPDDQQNKHLAFDLKAEYSGIMNWLVRGARKLERAHFQFPKTVKGRKFQAMTEGENDSVRSYFSMRGFRFYSLSMDDKAVEFKSEYLYEDFQRYCELNGFDNKEVTKNQFGRDITRISEGGVKKRRTMNGMSYFLYGVPEDDLLSDPPIISEKFTLGEGETFEDVMYDDL